MNVRIINSQDFACYYFVKCFQFELPLAGGKSLQYTGTITVCLVTLWHKMWDTMLIFSNLDQT